MHISIESPAHAEIEALIQALDVYQTPLYPAESHHGIGMDALIKNNVLFAVARNDEREVVACGAVLMKGLTGELKRMYTLPAQRGKGIARALLSFLEEAAISRGCTEFVLETGNRQPEAVALYHRCGYRVCGPFGNYTEDPNSIFMRKTAVLKT